jgi:hypothetical protein
MLAPLSEQRRLTDVSSPSVAKAWSYPRTAHMTLGFSEQGSKEKYRRVRPSNLLRTFAEVLGRDCKPKHHRHVIDHTPVSQEFNTCGNTARAQ